MNEVKKCPKCSEAMKNGLRLVSFTEITVAKENQNVGDYIDVFMCQNCGYIELYKEKRE